MNYNLYLNQCSSFEWGWLLPHFEASPVRYAMAKQALELCESKVEIRYQLLNWKTYQVQDLVKQIDRLRVLWREEKATKDLKGWLCALVAGEGIDLFAAVQFIERDAEACRRRKRFCYPKAELFRFLLKQLKDRAFLNRDYESMNRLIVLDDFYQPYFKINEEVHAFARKVNYSVRMLDWQKLDDIRGVTLNYLDTYKHQLCISTKLVLYRFLIGQYFYTKMPERIEEVLDAIFREYCLLPYYNQHELEVLGLVTFYNNLTHIGKYDLALKYYRQPQLDLKDSAVRGNFYAFLGIALETYDLKVAKIYVDELSKEPIRKLRPTLLYLLARYYLLTKNMEKVEEYILAAIHWVNNSKSYEFYFETYSVYFRYLYWKEDYSEILKIKQSNRFRKHYKSIQKFNIHLVEIELYLLLSKYCRNSIREETFNRKLFQLLEPSTVQLNGFLKLRLIENLMRFLLDPRLRITSANKSKLKQLKKEMQLFDSISSLDLMY